MISIILSEFQDGTRNARVYQTTNGEYGVVTFDASDDYNGFAVFDLEEDAEIYAEDWVTGHEPI